jgi:hypothetical protein
MALYISNFGFRIRYFRIRRLRLTVGVFAIAAGCAQLNDPFKDSGYYTNSEMTTPSTEAYLASGEAPPPGAQRDWEAKAVYYEKGTVTHWPLWFEDPFEEKGNDVTDPSDRDAPDNRFAWNAVDYLHIAYGPGRFLLNLGGLPISAVIQPPGCPMASDGRLSQGFLGYDHDARYARHGDEPPDFNDLWRTSRMPRQQSQAAAP